MMWRGGQVSNWVLGLALVICLAGYGRGQADGRRHTDVKTLERAFAAEMQLKATHVPFVGAASGLARAFTHGGVRGLKMVTYDDLPANVDRAAMEQLARIHLSGAWTVLVYNRETAPDGDDVLVWVQPAGDRVRLLVMNLEAGEMTLSQVELNPEQLARWQEQHGS